jgi:segregation and condensation protein B
MKTSKPNAKSKTPGKRGGAAPKRPSGTATAAAAGEDSTNPADEDESERTLVGIGGPAPSAPPELPADDTTQDPAPEAGEDRAPAPGEDDDAARARAREGDGDGDGATSEGGAQPDGAPVDGDAGDEVSEGASLEAAESGATDGAAGGGDGEAAPDAPAAELEDEETTPVPTDNARLESVLESVLFAADKPLTVADLRRLLGERDGKRITEALETVRERRAESGIQLVSVAGGWQLRTHPGNGAWVAKLVAGRPQRLSRAMMETLAIVAYRQPITRPEIDEIRGVDCGPVLRTLLDRGLIRAIGKKEEVGRPILYGTTPEFLKTFSLRDLTELPTLREFHELGDDDRAKVDSVAPAAAGSGSPLAGAATPGVDTLPSASELPTYDPREEEDLIGELDRASAAATRAVRPPTEPATDGEGDGDGEPEAETVPNARSRRRVQADDAGGASDADGAKATEAAGDAEAEPGSEAE